MSWKRKYEEKKFQAHMLLREVDSLNNQIAEVPVTVRLLFRSLMSFKGGRFGHTSKKNIRAMMQVLGLAE
jgi:hypothetical protein